MLWLSSEYKPHEDNASEIKLVCHLPHESDPVTMSRLSQQRINCICFMECNTGIGKLQCVSQIRLSRDIYLSRMVEEDTSQAYDFIVLNYLERGFQNYGHDVF